MAGFAAHESPVESERFEQPALGRQEYLFCRFLTCSG